MTLYQCLYCKVTFATAYALKRHISGKHNNIEEDKGETSQSKITYEEEPGLWDDDFTTEEATKESELWDDNYDLPIDDPMVRLR